MQPYFNQNAAYPERDKADHHEKCRKHLYHFVQVELNDGSIYQGILHSYDGEKMYLLMPRDHHRTDETSGENRLFPFFGPFGLFGFPFFGIRRFGPFFPFFI
ncbi:hypothetical protein D8M04_17245 [Oceanobacillus piezotolerans]|uniref:Uncharacterized protein n=1 Tax=Oceanobacillus piezotolerans TaxID=2448030 RepID=A0A498D4U1_9BACI|nr:hypothetical protein [Oceanobacillus piezotolerans]RLL41811.1 hypothetical protein D8M04_17245 [Oceanobacillus piezotolerans]